MIQAAELIQSAVRGHTARQKNLNRMKGFIAEDDSATDDDSGMDNAAELIQSNIRGHAYRKQLLQK